jgi:hypothetical protein
MGELGKANIVGVAHLPGYPRPMAKVVHLSPDQVPRNAKAWVRVRRSGEGSYEVEVCKDSSSEVVLAYDIRPATFSIAVGRAKQHADAIGVKTVYVIGVAAND